MDKFQVVKCYLHSSKYPKWMSKDYKANLQRKNVHLLHRDATNHELITSVHVGNSIIIYIHMALYVQSNFAKSLSGHKATSFNEKAFFHLGA